MDPTRSLASSPEDWQKLINQANTDVELAIKVAKLMRALQLILFGGAIVSAGAIIYGVRLQIQPAFNWGLIGVIACPVFDNLIGKVGSSIRQDAEKDAWILLHNKHQEFIEALAATTSWAELSKLWKYKPRQLAYAKIMPETLAREIDSQVCKWRALEEEKERFGVNSTFYAQAEKQIGQMNVITLIKKFRELRSS